MNLEFFLNNEYNNNNHKKRNQKIENPESLPYSIWIGPKCDL